MYYRDYYCAGLWENMSLNINSGVIILNSVRITASFGLACVRINETLLYIYIFLKCTFLVVFDVLLLSWKSRQPRCVRGKFPR